MRDALAQTAYDLPVAKGHIDSFLILFLALP